MQLGDLLLGLLVLILYELLHELAGLVPEVVVADVHLYLAVVDIDDVRADVVEEVSVMRNDENRALIIHEEILEPHDACEIEVVRRLVEQDNIGRAEQCLCKQHLDLKARIHIAHHRFVEVRRNAEPLKYAACVGLGFPAAEFGKLLFKLGRTYAVGVVEIGLVVYRVLFLAAVVKALVAHDYGVHNGVIIVHVLVLLEHGHALFRGDGDGAC